MSVIVFFHPPLLCACDLEELLTKALASYEERNYKLAISYFEKCSSFSILQDYVFYWWANSLEEIGKDRDAILIYRRIPPASPIRKIAVERLAGLYRKKKDWLNALDMIKERISLEKNKKLKVSLYKEAVELGYLSGTPSSAADSFKKLIESFPDTQEAMEIVLKFGDIYSFKDSDVAKANVYLRHKLFEKVLEILSGREDRKGLRLKAEAFYGMKNYKQAISILERLVKERNGDDLKLRLGEVYLASAWEDKGLDILETLSREREGSSIACISLWKLLNYWKDRGDEKKVEIYCRQLRERYINFSLSDKAIWIEGWLNFNRKDYARASEVWEVFDRVLRSSREKLSAMYLRRWIKKMSGKDREAEDISRKISQLFPDTYYGLICQKETSFRPDLWHIPETGDLENSSDFERANLLIRLNRIEEVIFELEALKKKRYNDINLRYNLSLFYGRAGRFYDAINEAESLVDFFEEMGKWPGFLHISDRKILEINFPRFYRSVVEEKSRRFNVDENLIYAIIREESRFNERDVSPSGAIGPMQIMPSTGKWIMEKMDMKNFSIEALFKPEVNILLGSWYLRYLLDRFGGDVLLAVASYNGGPGLIGRWAEKGISDRELAIEMMPRNETKYYCQKVLFSYYMYGMIYGNN